MNLFNKIPTKMAEAANIHGDNKYDVAKPKEVVPIIAVNNLRIIFKVGS